MQSREVNEKVLSMTLRSQVFVALQNSWVIEDLDKKERSTLEKISYGDFLKEYAQSYYPDFVVALKRKLLDILNHNRERCTGERAELIKSGKPPLKCLYCEYFEEEEREKHEAQIHEYFKRRS